MARIIQDSDEELDPPSPVQEHDVNATAQIGSKADNSSGDLVRGIHAAQDALTTELAVPNLDGSSEVPGEIMSSPLSSSKRRKTAKTYGSASKRSRTMAYDEAERFALFKNEVTSPRGSKEEPWLPSTLKGQFESHNPDIMFGDPSSTIPDNTATQQQVIQLALQRNQATAPDVQGKNNQTQQSESSIPWSAYIDSPKKTPKSSRMRSVEPTHRIGTQGQSSAKKRSQTVSTFRKGFSQTPLRASHDDTLVQSNISLRSPDFLQRGDNSELADLKADPSSLPKPVQTLSEIEVHDEIIIEQDRAMSAQKPLRFPRRKTESVSMEVKTNSDELWIGIPKEQYKPRASTSRALRVTDEEYQLAVEQTLRPQKRQKTTQKSKEVNRRQADSIVKPDFDANEVDEDDIPANSPRPSVEEPKLEDMEDKENQRPARNASDLEDVKSATATARSTLVEVAIPPAASIKRKLEPESGGLLIKGARAVPPIAPPVAPPVTASPRKRGKKASRSHTIAAPGAQRTKVLDSDESDAEISPMKEVVGDFDEMLMPDEPGPTIVPEVAPVVEKKKRGRGRPRKSDAAKTALEVAENKEITARTSAATNKDKDNDDSGHETNDDQGPDEHTESRALAHEDEDVKKVAQQHSPVKSKPPMPPQATPEQADKGSPSPLKTPESKPSKAVSHSPISKGKVPYRVGLSKRARIAPLLRVMKK